jgi:hypothetical protein
MGDPFGRDDPRAFSPGDERVAVQGESGLQELQRLGRRHGFRSKQCDPPLHLLRIEQKRGPGEPANLSGDSADVYVLEGEDA